MIIFSKFILFITIASRIVATPVVLNFPEQNRVGLFASLNMILGQLKIYEEGLQPNITGFQVNFKNRGLYYDPEYGENWWSYYFEPISIGDAGNEKCRVLTKEEILKGCLVRRQMKRCEVGDIVKKYFRPLKWLMDDVDEFVNREFSNFYIVGVHYRGTDKQKEAPVVSYDLMFDQVRKSIPTGMPSRIFVATDEQAFLCEIQREFPGKVISIDAHRSVDAIGVHFYAVSPFELGREAIVDALLLSKCHILVRTSSNLSLWATYFNPDLPVVLMNQRYAETLEPE